MEELLRTLERVASDLERLTGELRSVAAGLPSSVSAEREESIGSAQAPVSPAFEPAPPPADARGAVASLSRITEAIGSLNYLVGRADCAFIEQAPGVLDKLSDEDLRGQKGMKFLYQLLSMADALGAAYRSPKTQGLQKACEEAASALVPLIEAHGVRVSPRPGEKTEGRGLKKTPVSSVLPEGVIMAVKKRALLKGEQVLEEGEIFVSNGQWGQPQELLDSVAQAVMSGGPSGNEALDRARHKAWQQVHSYLEELPGAGSEKVHTLYRYAINSINKLPRAGPVKDAMGGLIEALREGGFREIPVPLGRKFDETFSPSRYERKRVKSDRPRDAIVEIVQRGFVNEKGIPVQKAIVGVSAGT